MNDLQRAAVTGLLRAAADALEEHGCTAEHEEHPDLIYRLRANADTIDEVKA